MTAVRKIITEHVYPPIPVRDMDWRATFDGYEPGDPIGTGPNEQAAINDLTAQEYERKARREFDELVAAAQCAANVLSLLDAEVKALGLRAENVPERLRAAIARATS